jgi:hypothetical protein
MAERPFSDPEVARAAQRKSAESRRRRAALKEQDPEAYLVETFSAKKAELSEQLLKAALGQDEWHELPLDKRLTALTKALEYAVGKPTTQKSAPSSEAREPEPQGLSIV